MEKLIYITNFRTEMLYGLGIKFCDCVHQRGVVALMYDSNAAERVVHGYALPSGMYAEQIVQNNIAQRKNPTHKFCLDCEDYVDKTMQGFGDLGYKVIKCKTMEDFINAIKKKDL